MLVTCNECGEKISEDTHVCPYCGYRGRKTVTGSAGDDSVEMEQRREEFNREWGREIEERRKKKEQQLIHERRELQQAERKQKREIIVVFWLSFSVFLLIFLCLAWYLLGKKF